VPKGMSRRSFLRQLGGLGVAISSSPGRLFSPQEAPSAVGSLFVTTGFDHVSTSPDGKVWSAASIPTGQWCSASYMASAGLWCAIGYNDHRAMTSADGKTWSLSSTTVPYSTRNQGSVIEIRNDGIRFMIVGYDAANPDSHWMFASSSVDGVNWSGSLHTGFPLGVQPLGLAFGNGVFATLTGTAPPVIYTTPGSPVSWTGRANTVSAALNRIIHDGQRFVAVGNAWVEWNTTPGNLDAWTRITPPAGANTLRYIGLNGTTYLIIAQNTAATSTDLTNWTSRSDPTGGQVLPVCAGDPTTGRFVWIGDNGAAWGNDGISWTTIAAPFQGAKSVMCRPAGAGIGTV